MISKRSSRAWLIRLLCAIVLFAQQSALTHAVWHAAAGQAPQQNAESTYDGERTPGQHSNPLCAFDAAFGQALGAGPAMPDLPLLPAAPSEPVVHLGHGFTAADAVTPRSRGPPARL